MREKKFLRNIRVAISSVCNMHCLYCEGVTGFNKEGRTASMEDIRRKPLKEGSISTKELLDILSVFYKAGFNGVSFTGGEPTLNKDWDYIVNSCKEIGYERREMTTNGLLLGNYIKKNGGLPALTQLKVSFDTDNKEDFNKTTRGLNFDTVVESVQIASNFINEIRANKVILRRDLPYLKRYLEFCQSIGFNAVNLLELIARTSASWTKENAEFFNEQFVPYAEILDELKKIEAINPDRYKYGHISNLSNGFKIMATDSRYTIRDDQCKNCPIYCQEGKFTVRVATDGNITMCQDYIGAVPSIDGIEALKNGSLEEKLVSMHHVLTDIPDTDTFDKFCKKYSLKIRN